MGRSSQAKGKRGEEELANILNGYGFQVKRGGSLTFGNVPDITGLPDIHIEVKRVEALNVDKAMAQAERDSAAFLDGMPTLFYRKNRGSWRVVMGLEDWMKLYKKWGA